MIKGFIFDLDGVLADTTRYHFAAWKHVAAKLNFDLREKQNEELKGVSRKECLDKIVGWSHSSLSTIEFQRCLEQKNLRYLELLQGLQASDYLPGVKRFLTEARKLNLRLGLGSASENAGFILEKLHLFHFFDAIVDGTNISRSKPHPQVFELGANQLKLNPNCIVVFEDSKAGLEAALRGGFKTVGIGNPKILSKAHLHSPSLENYAPAEIINQFNLMNV